MPGPRSRAYVYDVGLPVVRRVPGRRRFHPFYLREVDVVAWVESPRGFHRWVQCVVMVGAGRRQAQIEPHGLTPLRRTWYEVTESLQRGIYRFDRVLR
jgi:hypothetical protein